MSSADRKRNSMRKRQTMGKEKDRGKCWCCRRLLAFLFSHIGLGFLVFAYSLVGAFIFRHFEEPYEKGKALEVFSIRNTTVHKLWTKTLELNVLYKENWTSMASIEIEKFQQNLIQAVREGYDGKQTTGTSNHNQWSLFGSWIYSVTVITTIDPILQFYTVFRIYSVFIHTHYAIQSALCVTAVDMVVDMGVKSSNQILFDIL
ncbi:unnamed protein product [Medioppia subpectinata]|uniref:Uncharacterized protein n=1 Tax=Medioppia subpectinata TaxID=1979941 RepID=A0A7R9KXQ8_9ACAR|nr:unnamed protein product [Medioppia subpectinata]CAG2110512.1 unnamed protein product [Medioppia subpectinata]